MFIVMQANYSLIAQSSISCINNIGCDQEKQTAVSAYNDI